MRADQFLVDNQAGWRLAMTRMRPAGDQPVAKRPVLIVPGYGMNSYIFGFHPRGPSMVECFATRGIETWTVDLRGQGRSIRARGGTNRYGLAELAVDDLGIAIAHVIANTATGAKTLDVIGCSLGTALTFGHISCVPDAPVHALVSMAGLVTWKGAHPLVRFAFSSPRLVGLMRLRNTRRFARLALPVLSKVAPSLLSVYLNEQSTDLTQVAKLVQTVEDPHPVINREIGEWIKRRDLVIRGVNVSQMLPSIDKPFFCVVANDDGIVLPVTSRHTYDAIGSTTKRLLLVGDSEQPIAHADLFLCNGAQERIFAPIADFLLEV